ncbi:MAG: 2-oxoglutarate dehydrogenase E1 component (EC, partial [uncultured Thiotrichaceae bacterium]
GDWANFLLGFEMAESQPTPVNGHNGAATDSSSSDHAQGLTSEQWYVSQGRRLVTLYRLVGHLAAKIDPLKLTDRELPPELNPEKYGLGPEAMDTPLLVKSIDPEQPLPLSKIIEILSKVYCGSIGSEFFHIASTKKRNWLKRKLESTRGDWSQTLTTGERCEVLTHLIAAEDFERYLHRRYVGQKRFSLEGGESLIPVLDRLIQNGGEQGISDMVLGMAHRGRLNVLVNILGKSPQDLFSEFEDRVNFGGENGSGDVKYHQGFYSDIQTDGGRVHLALAFNPSHLEIVSPVVEGGVRARQDRYPNGGKNRVLPIAIHGDAAFIGQGVTAETLNLAQTEGFGTGGTIHIVVNNQVGFTTTSRPGLSRSSIYCTEVAKMIQAPIFHVNGDDPDALTFVTKLALEYRMLFNDDVVIDLVCYRRHGHNEADEPMVTQPEMYRHIKQHPTTRALYADKMIKEGVLSREDIDELTTQYRHSLDKGRVVVREFLTGSRNGYGDDRQRFVDATEPDTSVHTAVSEATLQKLGKKLVSAPDDFVLQKGVAKLQADRGKMLTGELQLDWGMAETLAYASLLRDGLSVRLSGQDSGRGTFAHRHAILHDQDTSRVHLPLQHLFINQPKFTVINSLLSELAVLGFEYGYATSSSDSLVIWEAQFGDFANCAQVVIDQFISSGLQKWGRICQLTMFLPHGYEGQGPEHSSARLERFLQLCAQLNMRVWVPTTPAQLFHLLRDQMLRDFRRPLIVMMPKSLLRHPLSKSDLSELTDGGLQVCLPEQDELDAAAVRRVVLCSGKVYYDLLKQRRERNIQDIAIVRVEQLYPFPRRALAGIMEDYPQAVEIVWCQDEPRNQGAWYQIQHHLWALLDDKHRKLGYAGRDASASPACGSPTLHAAQQKALIDTALSPELVEDQGERLEW